MTLAHSSTRNVLEAERIGSIAGMDPNGRIDQCPAFALALRLARRLAVRRFTTAHPCAAWAVRRAPQWMDRRRAPA